MKKIILLSILLVGLTSMSYAERKHGARINASCKKGGIAKFHVEYKAFVLAYFRGTYNGRSGQLGSDTFYCKNPKGCTFTHTLSTTKLRKLTSINDHLEKKVFNKGIELSRHFIRVRGKNEKISIHSAGCR